MSSTPTANYSFSKPAQGDTPWTTQIDGNFDSIDSEIARPRIPFNSPTVGATTTCDLSLARIFKFTVTQNTTVALTNAPSASFAVRIRLLITNGGAFALTFPASVSWLAGIAPSFKASGVDEVEMLTTDAGATWFATLRNLRPGIIFQNNTVSTTSTSDVSLTSYPLPGGTLAVNGQRLRVTVMGLASAQNCTINLKWGASVVLNTTVVAGNNWRVEWLITRTGAATQTSEGFSINGTAVALLDVAGSETLSGPVTIDFRGSVVAGGTLFLRTVQVEYLAVA